MFMFGLNAPSHPYLQYEKEQTLLRVTGYVYGYDISRRIVISPLDRFLLSSICWQAKVQASLNSQVGAET